MQHSLSPKTAANLINTTYVVFLGILFSSSFSVSGNPTPQVSFLFTEAHWVMQSLLLVYFVFSWFCWNAMFQSARITSDVQVALCIFGIVALGAAFLFTLDPVFPRPTMVFWAFALYAVLSYQDDAWLFARAHKASQDKKPDAGLFLFFRIVCFGFRTLFIGVLLWGFLFLFLMSDEEWFIEACLEKMELAIAVLTSLKVADYVAFTRWKAARQIIAT